MWESCRSVVCVVFDVDCKSRLVGHDVSFHLRPFYHRSGLITPSLRCVRGVVVRCVEVVVRILEHGDRVADLPDAVKERRLPRRELVVEDLDL